MTEELRRPLLLRTAVEVLRDTQGPVPAGDVLSAIEQRVALNEHELSRNNSGFARFDTFVRFSSGWLASVGWITKSSDGWLLTDAGRDAMETYPDPDFLKELSRRYRQERKAKRLAPGWKDARWPLVRDAVDAVGPGSWTAYKDLADLVGLPPQTIGSFLQSNEIEHAYRVLTIDGTLAPDFKWSDPSRTDSPVDLLRNEGVDFDDQAHASPAQRVTVDELRAFVGSTPTTGQRAWLVRGSAVGGVNVVPQWLTEGFVSISASKLRLVESGIGLDELRAVVDEDYAHLTYNQRQSKTAELHAFLNRMSVGDAVVTTAEGAIHVGRVSGEAEFSPDEDSRTTLRRDVEWSSDGLDFASLPESLQSRLKASATVVDLTEVSEAIDSLLGEPEAPLSPQVMPEAHLRSLTADEAARLLVDRSWLDEMVELLGDRRQIILYGPPGTGKTYLALEVAAALTDPANVTLVQFHPAYSYEDFFEGYRPSTVDDSGRVGFALTPGPFRKIVDRAREDPGTPYVLIVDEINRANLAKVFGELYFLLEYRDRTIDLMYASGDEGRDFTLPKNVFVIGTMNTADRSIALVDSAMRRRFAFLSLHPDDAHLRRVLRLWLEREGLPEQPAALLDELNRRIPDKDFKVGPSYLMRSEVATYEGLDRIWRTSILPLLEELHYGDESVDIERRYGLPGLLRAVQPPPPAAVDDGVEPGAETSEE